MKGCRNKKINNGILYWRIAKELWRLCKMKLRNENICWDWATFGKKSKAQIMMDLKSWQKQLKQ
jgi:hypothetical protein